MTWPRESSSTSCPQFPVPLLPTPHSYHTTTTNAAPASGGQHSFVLLSRSTRRSPRLILLLLLLLLPLLPLPPLPCRHSQAASPSSHTFLAPPPQHLLPPNTHRHPACHACQQTTQATRESTPQQALCYPPPSLRRSLRPPPVLLAAFLQFPVPSSFHRSASWPHSLSTLQGEQQ